MKKTLSVIASVAIVAGAYFLSFGVPDALMSDAARENAAQAEAGQGAGGPPSGGPPGGGSGATTVVMTPLELQPYEDSFRAVGSSEALQSATVTSDVSGRIVEISLTPNADASQGDILVQLDARDAELSLEIAQAEREQAADTVARYERLKASGNSTVSDVTISEANLALRLADATMGQAELDLDDRTIRAPISGKLGLSDLNVGDYLSANTSITTIDNAGVLLVEFELPERSVGFLSIGREVALEAPSLTGRIFTGEITSFDSRIDDVTRSVTVKAQVENEDEILWPGMTFTARLTNFSEPLTVVPTTAITWSRDGASLWYADKGVATPSPVTILYRREELVWVDVDLPVGTNIITEGAHKLRAGSQVTDANAEPQQGMPGGEPADMSGSKPSGDDKPAGEAQ